MEQFGTMVHSRRVNRKENKQGKQWASRKPAMFHMEHWKSAKPNRKERGGILKKLGVLPFSRLKYSAAVL